MAGRYRLGAVLESAGFLRARLRWVGRVAVRWRVDRRPLRLWTDLGFTGRRVRWFRTR